MRQTELSLDRLEVVLAALDSGEQGFWGQKPKQGSLSSRWSPLGARATEPGGRSRRLISRQPPEPAGRGLVQEPEAGVK